MSPTASRNPLPDSFNLDLNDRSIANRHGILHLLDQAIKLNTKAFDTAHAHALGRQKPAIIDAAIELFFSSDNNARDV